jgi:hypothetical protein
MDMARLLLLLSIDDWRALPELHALLGKGGCGLSCDGPRCSPKTTSGSRIANYAPVC